MIKKLLVLTTLGVLVSGCFMGPMAFIGPATSGFSTASIAQSGTTSLVNHVYKKNTGKTIVEHALIVLKDKRKEVILSSIQQTFAPKNTLSKTNSVTHYQGMTVVSP
jgi:hypothetical protein